jgi:hypothetical protein
MIIAALLAALVVLVLACFAVSLCQIAGGAHLPEYDPSSEWSHEEEAA